MEAPNAGGYVNAAEVAENWRLSTRSVVNLARSQVHMFAVLQCVACDLSLTGDPCKSSFKTDSAVNL